MSISGSVFLSGEGTTTPNRHTIGTGVMGGMVGATVFGVLFVPVFYAVVRRLLGDKTE